MSIRTVALSMTGTFGWLDIAAKTKCTQSGALSEMARLVKSGQLRRVSKGLYCCVHVSMRKPKKTVEAQAVSEGDSVSHERLAMWRVSYARSEANKPRPGIPMSGITGSQIKTRSDFSANMIVNLTRKIQQEEARG